MQPTPDDDRPTAIEICQLPRIPADLTVEQADALRAEIWASDSLPDSAKVKLAQQINYRLAEAAGKGQQPRAVSSGVFFNGAQPDEVQRQLRAMKAHR